MGNHAGGIRGSTVVGGTGGRGALGRMGRFPGVDGRFPERTSPFVGNYGGIGQGTSRQLGAFDGLEGYDIPPQPYRISYEAMDEHGGTHFKTVSGDGSGNVQGNYGYFDSHELYRQVENTADQFGFRANIKTNEPRVGKKSPADVNMIVEQTPTGIQEQYTPATAYHSGMSGQHCVELIYFVGSARRGLQGGISGEIPRSPASAEYPAAVVGGRPVSFGYQGCGMSAHSLAEQGYKVAFLDYLLE